MIWSERLFIKVIPKIVDNISSPKLISIMKDHSVVTDQQIKRLQKISELISVSALGKNVLRLKPL
jgi:ferritin-like metal-binding protein YciE